MTDDIHYELTLMRNFFREDNIDWILEKEHGAEYVLFYLKLCLETMATEGILIRKIGNKLIPYDVKKIAEITNTKIAVVATAMKLFEEIGLIEIAASGEINVKRIGTIGLFCECG